MKVRLEGDTSLSAYTKDGQTLQYMSLTGIDDLGDRVSMAFFCDDIRAQKDQLKSGTTVQQ